MLSRKYVSSICLIVFASCTHTHEKRRIYTHTHTTIITFTESYKIPNVPISYHVSQTICSTILSIHTEKHEHDEMYTLAHGLWHLYWVYGTIIVNALRRQRNQSAREAHHLGCSSTRSFQSSARLIENNELRGEKREAARSRRSVQKGYRTHTQSNAVNTASNDSFKMCLWHIQRFISPVLLASACSFTESRDEMSMGNLFENA